MIEVYMKYLNIIYGARVKDSEIIYVLEKIMKDNSIEPEAKPEMAEKLIKRIKNKSMLSKIPVEIKRNLMKRKLKT